jgi:hypothetical protein
MATQTFDGLDIKLLDKLCQVLDARSGLDARMAFHRYITAFGTALSVCLESV